MKQLTALYCLVALLFAPRVGTAIDLRWSSGGQSLSFEGARTCTLVVEAEASQTQLPHEWRIVWAVEGCMITVLAAEPSALWRADTAEVCEIDQAVSATDVEAHQTMAYMCSDGDLPARRAVIPIAIDRAGRGKFRALALEGAAVPGQAIARSAEVTFNGGSAATYPPIILNAISTHDANHVLVEALGTGFDRLDGFAVAGADTSWRVNLDVQTLSDTTVLGTAVVSARLPEGVLRGTTSDGALAFASLPPDELVEPMALGPAVSMWDSSGYIRPKETSLSPTTAWASSTSSTCERTSINRQTR